MTEGLSERILAMAVARRFYLDGRSKLEIGRELGVSRFRVARIIEKALRDGLVRIEFDNPAGGVDYELSSTIKSRFRLKNAIVVDDHGGDTDLIIDNMAQVAAELLRDISGPDDVLGFAWTRVMEAMTPYLGPLKARAVVQLGGAWPGANAGRTNIDLVRDLARLCQGKAYTFYAPLMVSDAAAAEAIRRQPDVRAAASMLREVTLAFVGLGAWREGGSSLWPALTAEQRAHIRAQGVVAETCGVTLDSAGHVVESDLTDMSIGVPAADLVACPDVLALAFGLEKVEAILAAIRGGVIKSLVTHVAVAKSMLQAGK
jgi:DNA-binding transcriptional regulator LsrR (DeoR family)